MRAVTLGLFVVSISIIAYVLGPVKIYDELEFHPLNLSLEIHEVEDYILELENAEDGIRVHNEARVIWADSIPKKTNYSVVYLHGFSASHEEGAPVHREVAKALGANLYLSRLSQHGLEDSLAFVDLTPTELLQSAKEALMIGRNIGEKVIIMACSSGATLSIPLIPADSSIIVAILYSPNIAVSDPMARLVNDPWGEQILNQVLGGDYNHIDYDSLARPFWYSKYHLNGLIALQELIEQTMTLDVFERVSIPIFVGCYYKSEEEKDNVISIDAMKRFFAKVGTTNDQKMWVDFPESGNHVISSHLMSNDVEGVIQETLIFLKAQLNLEI